MIQKTAIIGAGLIGRSWAMVFARAGHQVTLYDPYKEALNQACRLIKINLSDMETRGLISSAKTVRALIETSQTIKNAVCGANWIQENAVEQLEVKRDLFAKLDKLASPNTIIASSTSAIPCHEITLGIKGANRMLVAHPANPPYLIPIVELSGSSSTSPDTLRRARTFLESINMSVITINKETKGFVLNRLQVALLSEAFKLIKDGVVSGEDLDKTIKHGLGLRWSFMGPMETIDLNAPNGIRDYLERFGPSFSEIAEEQAEFSAWTSEKFAILEAERRKTMPFTNLAERTKWRDRRLMALAKHKQESDEEFGI